MELDKRIKSIDSIRSFNTNNDDCVCKFGYFTNYVTNFDDLNSIRKGICVFKDGSRFPFHADSIESKKFQFFIPENELLPKKKQYRPYKDIEEFCNQGFQMVVFREKQTGIEYHVLFNGYRLSRNGTCLVILGNLSYGLKELFIKYEILDSDGIWKPFGVER